MTSLAKLFGQPSAPERIAMEGNDLASLKCLTESLELNSDLIKAEEICDSLYMTRSLKTLTSASFHIILTGHNAKLQSFRVMY